MLESVLSPFRVLVEHRRIIEAFVRRDIRGRYASSVMGSSWAIVQPLALLLLYTFVFSYVLKIRFGPQGGSGTFALYLFCGMLPWLAFAEALTRASAVVIEQTPLIKKVVFPSEILPVYAVVSALVMEAIGLGVLLLAVMLQRGLAWSLVLLPVVIGLQFLFTMGLAWLVASVNVFLRDVGQLLGLGLTLWMFLTPIFYPATMMPARFGWVAGLNPMYYVVEAYRDLVLEGQLPAPADVGVLAGMASTTFVLGYWFFRRSKHAFVDVL